MAQSCRVACQHYKSQLNGSDQGVWKGLEKVMVGRLSPCLGCSTSKKKGMGQSPRQEADSTC